MVNVVVTTNVSVQAHQHVIILSGYYLSSVVHTGTSPHQVTLDLNNSYISGGGTGWNRGRTWMAYAETAEDLMRKLSWPQLRHCLN